MLPWARCIVPARGVWVPIFCPIRPSLILPLGHRSQTFFCWVRGGRVCRLIRCLDPAWCLRAGEGNSVCFITILFNIYWKWERFRRSSTSQLQCHCLLVPGGWRKGRPDELFPIAVGGVIPGVGLDDELLAAKAQTTPARQKKLQERWRRGNAAGIVGTLTVCQGGRCSTSCTRQSRTRGCSRWWQNRPACSIRPTWTASPARQGRMSTERRSEREEQYEESTPLVTVGPALPMLTGPSKLWL